jgi:hypothetical protein
MPLWLLGACKARDSGYTMFSTSALRGWPMAYLDSLSSPFFASVAFAWLSTMDIQLNSAVWDSLPGVSRQPAVLHFCGVFTQPTTKICLLRFSGITLWVGLDGLASLFVVVSCCTPRAVLPAPTRSLGIAPHELWVPWLASTFVHDFSMFVQPPRRILSHLTRLAPLPVWIFKVYDCVPPM